MYTVAFVSQLPAWLFQSRLGNFLKFWTRYELVTLATVFECGIFVGHLGSDSFFFLFFFIIFLFILGYRLTCDFSIFYKKEVKVSV